MKLHIYNKSYNNIFKIYIVKVNTLIGKRAICYIIANDISFLDFISGGIDNIKAEYNYIEYFNKDCLYKYTRHTYYNNNLRIKFTKYMTFIVWKDRNVTITKLKRFIKSPINIIKNIIFEHKIKSKTQDFEEFYNK